MADSYEKGNTFLGSIKAGKFLDYMSDYQLLKKDLLHGIR
jgi:hypothetical protein